MHTDFFKMLADAVVVRAGKDLRSAYKNENVREIKKITKFFLSNYFATLSNLEPDFILRKIRENSEKTEEKEGVTNGSSKRR